MRLTPSDTVDHVDLNRSFRRPSSSHEERILRRNLPPPKVFDHRGDVFRPLRSALLMRIAAARAFAEPLTISP